MGKQKCSALGLANIKREGSGWFFCHACQKWGFPKDKERERCSHCAKLLFEVLVYKERERLAELEDARRAEYKFAGGVGECPAPSNAPSAGG